MDLRPQWMYDQFEGASELDFVTALRRQHGDDFAIQTMRNHWSGYYTDAMLDAAKALGVRGKAHRYLGAYEKAKTDLSLAQRIDYDDSIDEVQKWVNKRVVEMNARTARAAGISSLWRTTSRRRSRRKRSITPSR